MVDAPVISVVITAYTVKRLDNIYELLDSIKHQNYPRVELIFVVERSEELLRKIKGYVVEKEISNAKVLFNSGEWGLSAGRNVGIKHATGDIIAFVDDDTVLYPDWAAETAKAYHDDSTIGITGPAFPLWEDEAMSWFPEELYWIISCTGWSGWQQVREVRNAWGMNMSFRREVFEKNLFSNEFGYHVGAIAEDNEFSLRVKEASGKKIIYTPNTKLWHRVYKYRLSSKFIKERAYWIGVSRRNLKKLNKHTPHNGDILHQENDLVRRILFHLFPNIIKMFFHHPGVAWRQMYVTINALAFVARGYFFPSRKKANLRKQTDLLQNIKEV